MFIIKYFSGLITLSRFNVFFFFWFILFEVEVHQKKNKVFGDLFIYLFFQMVEILHCEKYFYNFYNRVSLEYFFLHC